MPANSRASAQHAKRPWARFVNVLHEDWQKRDNAAQQNRDKVKAHGAQNHRAPPDEAIAGQQHFEGDGRLSGGPALWLAQHDGEHAGSGKGGACRHKRREGTQRQQQPADDGSRDRRGLDQRIVPREGR